MARARVKVGARARARARERAKVARVTERANVVRDGRQGTEELGRVAAAREAEGEAEGAAAREAEEAPAEAEEMARGCEAARNDVAVQMGAADQVAVGVAATAV